MSLHVGAFAAERCSPHLMKWVNEKSNVCGVTPHLFEAHPCNMPRHHHILL